MPIYKITDTLTGEVVAIEASNKNAAVNAITSLRFKAEFMTTSELLDYTEAGHGVIRPNKMQTELPSKEESATDILSETVPA